jgi:hypothetical protein
MKTTPYQGKVSGMKTSPWLASEDLLGIGPQKVKIEGVYRNEDVELDAGRKEALLFSIKFVGIPKQMILNATNRKALSGQFGADTKHWIGQEVELYVQDGIRKPGKGGGLTTGLRIKSNGTKMPAILPIAAPVVAASQEVEVETPAVDLWEEESK